LIDPRRVVAEVPSVTSRVHETGTAHDGATTLAAEERTLLYVATNLASPFDISKDLAAGVANTTITVSKL